MIEAAMSWNEPNNKSHWDPEIDPDWSMFADLVRVTGQAIAAENPHLPRVLGGISPIDSNFILNMKGKGALDHVDAVAVHGFPQMSFIERKYAGDERNWWVPNRAGVEAMLRSAGFEILRHPEEEVFLCRRVEIDDPWPRAVYPARPLAEGLG